MHIPRDCYFKQIAERLRAIGDEIDKDITDEMLTKLFNRSRSAFTMSRGDFTSTCAGILSRFQQSFPSGWYQISFVYHGKIGILFRGIKVQASLD